MVTFRFAKSTPIVLALAIAWLLAACSPKAPAPSGAEAVPHFADLVSAITSGSPEDLLALVHFSSLPCTKAEGMGGPPKCLADEAEGTPVEVLPILGPEGHHMRRSEFSSWPGLGDAQLYAAYRTSKSAYTDEYFPAGDYGVAFLLPDKTNVVVFQVNEDGIVRIDYTILPSIEETLKNSEIFLSPTPPAE